MVGINQLQLGTNMPTRTPTGVPSSDKSEMSDREPSKITEQEMLTILSRARQTVKPIVKSEASAEVVSEDILNFKMKSA